MPANTSRLLIERARATGARAVTLAVYRDNDVALGLYHSLGFEAVEARSSPESLYLRLELPLPVALLQRRVHPSLGAHCLSSGNRQFLLMFIRSAWLIKARMPIVSAFFGIVIRMFYREHGPPHFHAEYHGEHASLTFDETCWLETSGPGRPSA